MENGGKWDGSLFQKIKNIKTKKGPALEIGTVLFSKKIKLGKWHEEIKSKND